MSKSKKTFNFTLDAIKIHRLTKSVDKPEQPLSNEESDNSKQEAVGEKTVEAQKEKELKKEVVHVRKSSAFGFGVNGMSSGMYCEDMSRVDEGTEKAEKKPKINLKLPETGHFILEMKGAGIRLPTLALTIGKSRLSWAYNFLIGVLDDAVRVYIEEHINETLKESSDELLDDINDFAQEYLPLLRRVQAKAEVILEKKKGGGC